MYFGENNYYKVDTKIVLIIGMLNSPNRREY